MVNGYIVNYPLYKAGAATVRSLAKTRTMRQNYATELIVKHVVTAGSVLQVSISAGECFWAKAAKF